MANVSDQIEQFILNTLGMDREIQLCRNDLATFFAVAPSQINYVLETRFTVDKGFIKESRRGGGGFITLTRIPIEEETYINNLILESIGDSLSYKRAIQILSKLCEEEIIDKREMGIIKSAITEEVLALPVVLRENLRASIFKGVLLFLLREKHNG